MNNDDKPTTQTVAQFDIPYFRYLNPLGEVEQSLPAFSQDIALLHALYRMMLLTRLFDKKAIALQRTGKLGTYPSPLGQEAISVGIGAAMQPNDILCPYYRDYGAMFWRGVKMEEILWYWGGDERGSHFANNPHDFPLCIPIASQTLYATGVAFALSYRKEPRVVVTVIGDGGTSRGDFYEALNIAGCWNLPLVFVINNNQWAISVSRERQTKAQTLAQKGIAAGIPCWQIDGNDIIAVKKMMDLALEKARAGEGPTLIEAISYRMGDHTTADDASRYRRNEDLVDNQKKDPIIRLKNYLVSQQLWSEAQEQKLESELASLVDSAVANFDKMGPAEPESIFDYLYETLPKAYQAQREQVKKGDAA